MMTENCSILPLQLSIYSMAQSVIDQQWSDQPVPSKNKDTSFLLTKDQTNILTSFKTERLNNSYDILIWRPFFRSPNTLTILNILKTLN